MGMERWGEGGWKTSYYNSIIYNVYNLTAIVIKDVNCHDSILWCAIQFKTDSLLCFKQFPHKIKYFIYFDHLASCCWYPLLSFSKVCKERWNIKGCKLCRKIEKPGLSKRKSFFYSRISSTSKMV